MLWIKISFDRLLAAVRQFLQGDLRWTYVIVAGMALVGLAINFLLPHGWTVWPIVLTIAILVAINEAADRNGEGIPPLQVYGFFAGFVIIWIGLVMALSTLNPLIIVGAIIIMAYFCLRAYLQQREQQRIFDDRREQGLCVHCAEPVNPDAKFCNNCGEEPNPDGVLTKSTPMGRSGADRARTRAILTPQSPTAIARQKEHALLAKRHRRSSAKR